MKHLRILVTGSSGTIASSLIPSLKERGHKVIGIDRLNEGMHGINITDFIWDLNNTIPSRIGVFDVIIHLAANSRVYYSVLNPSFAQENYMTTYNVLEFARRQKEYNGFAPLVVFSSSREVYGNCPKLSGIKRKEQEQDNFNCESNYSASKIANECQIRAYTKQYDIPHLIFRFSNVVFGNDMSKDTVIPTWIRNAQNNENLILYGKDKQLDFTFIDDTVNGIISGVEKGIKNETINLGGGKPIKLLDLAKYIIGITNSKSKIIIKPYRRGEVTLYHANIEKANKLIGYKPTMDIKNELNKAVSEKRY